MLGGLKLLHKTVPHKYYLLLLPENLRIGSDHFIIKL